MVFHNSPVGFKGIKPSGDKILVDLSARELAPPIINDGLFYRTDIDLDVPGLVEKLLHNPDATVQDYQYWAETAWKKEQSTPEAVERFSDKLREELDEFFKAISDLENSPIKTDELKKEVISECGDVLWCVTALACCMNSDIDSGIKNLLYRYTMGVQHFSDGTVIEPKWRETVARFSTNREQTTISDLDKIISAGFEPLATPVMNIIDPTEDEGEKDDHILNLYANCMQYLIGINKLFNSPDATYVLGTYFSEQARQAGEVVAQIYLELAFLVNRTTGSDLTSVVIANVNKLSQRVSSNTVDKSDGSRDN